MMLKRTLTIGIALTMFVLAVGTVAAEVETSQAAPNEMTLTSTDAVYLLMWGDGTPGKALFPQRLADRLPIEVRHILADAYSGDYLQDSDDEDWDCYVAAGYPYDAGGGRVKARSDISCVGDPVQKTKLKATLYKATDDFGDVVLDYHNSQWVTWKAHGTTLNGTCVEGYTTYRNVTEGWAKIEGEALDFHRTWRPRKSLNCG